MNSSPEERREDANMRERVRALVEAIAALSARQARIEALIEKIALGMGIRPDDEVGGKKVTEKQ